jgi:hypothetical protein
VPDTSGKPLHLELFAITPVEVDAGVPNFPRVISSAKLIGVERTYERAERRAMGYASDNFGDHDFRVRDMDGREVARIQVRDGRPHTVMVAGGKTAAEELESLWSQCPYCPRIGVLIPCARCGAHRCVECLIKFVCCVPPTASPQEE